MTMFRSFAFALSLALATGCGGPARQSMKLYEAGDYAGAARVADDALAEDPDDFDLLAMRIRAALAQGDAPAIARTYARLAGDRDAHTIVDELAIATLEQALTSPSAKMKLIAIPVVERHELHDLGDLVAQRMEDRDDKVVAAAAGAILRGYAQAPTALKNMLSSPDPEARALAIDALGRKRNSIPEQYRASAMDDIRVAASDEDARVRRAAIRWLGHHRDTPSTDVITRHTKDRDEAVRAASYTALGRIGGSDLSALAGKALADKALAVRLAGVELYATANNTSALAALAESDANPTVAVEAAIQIKNRDAAKRQLAKVIADERWAIRAGGANMARRALDAADAETILTQLAKDPDVSVQLAAARALMSMGSAHEESAKSIFFAALQSPAHALSAAPDLVRLGDERGTAVLENTLREATQPADRLAAVAAHRTAHRITPWLVAALADANGLVRVEAAAALVDLTHEEDD